MALVQMNCKNCGAPLERRGTEYVCPHCGARVLDVVDAEGTDAPVISAEEFEKILEEQKKGLVLEYGGELHELDAEGSAKRAKLHRAESLLRAGKPHEADLALEGLSDTLFPAVRLRLFAEAGARDEAELACWAGDVHALRWFDRVYALCDFEQRRVYDRIEKSCAENVGILKEIGQGMEVLRAGDVEEALRVALALCRKYPAKAKSWELLCAARCLADEEYDPTEDVGRFYRCPDCRILYGPPFEGEPFPRTGEKCIFERMREVERRKGAGKAVRAKIFGILLTALLLATAAVVWSALDSLLG